MRTKLFFASRMIFAGMLILSLLAGCAPAPVAPLTSPILPAPTVTPTAAPSALPPAPARSPSPASSPTALALSADETSTLASLKKVDDYPLYILTYRGDYPSPYLNDAESSPAAVVSQPAWACSLFAALGDPAGRLFGRNFDWRFSPAVLLFTHPSDGYASVSMVDIEYLGFNGAPSREIDTLALDERRALLDAPSLPFDGMNEKGLAVGMAAVPPGNMRPDPGKQTIDELAAMREILDHAATVDEAVGILGRYNIDMGEVPIHYLIASAAGESALVEFSRGKMVVFRNDGDWQAMTNFLFAEASKAEREQDNRYSRLRRGLEDNRGRLAVPDALSLLADVAQSGGGSNTQWSVVYDLTGRAVHVVMGRNYPRVYTFHLDQAAR